MSRSRAAAGVVLAELGYQNVTLRVGDGTLGWPRRSALRPHHGDGRRRRAVPPALFEQLADGGLLVIPLGDTDSQVLQAVRKVGGAAQFMSLSRCRFVPLVGAQRPA